MSVNREPRDVVNTEVGPVDGDERRAKLVQLRLVGLVALHDVRFDQHDPHALPVLELADGVDAPVTEADSQRRLAGHLTLGDQIADRRIPAREGDPGFLADQAATAVASDEVPRPQHTAVGRRRGAPAGGELDVDAGIVLREARHLAFAIDRYRQLGDPGGEDALDLVLPEREPVVVASRKVADVERRHPEARDLQDLPLREEALRDSTLIEHLDGACMQTAGARAGELLADASLDDGHVHPRQGQLGRQHHPRRAPSDDHHRVLGHGPSSRNTTAGRSSPSASRGRS